jgi:hypothetical protein
MTKMDIAVLHTLQFVINCILGCMQRMMIGITIAVTLSRPAMSILDPMRVADRRTAPGFGPVSPDCLLFHCMNDTFLLHPTFLIYIFHFRVQLAVLRA